MSDQSNHASPNPAPELELELTCSRSDTCSTVDDQPGPGRILGTLYDYLGFRLEVILGKVATKVGRGPTVTAQRILRSRADLVSVSTASHEISCVCVDCVFVEKYGARRDGDESKSPTPPSKKLESGMNRDAKRLIRYVK